MEWKNKFAEMIEEKIKDSEMDSDNLNDLVQEVLECIDETFTDLESYETKDLVVIYDEYDNGFTTLNLNELGSSINDAIYNLLNDYLSIEDLQFQFLFLDKNGAKFASKLHLSELTI